MSASAVVRARVDQRIKEEAAAILGAAGLTISDAFRMMLMRTVADKALPFDPLVPTALIADLHADDEADRPLQTRLQARDQRPASGDPRP